MKLNFSKTSAVLLAPLTLATFIACSSSSHNGPTARVAGMVYGASSVTTDSAGNQTVTVSILAQDGIRKVSTNPVASSQVASIQTTLVAGNLVDWIPGSNNGLAMVPSDPNKTFQVILSKGTSADAQFVLPKYGPAVHTYNGKIGAMVAAGWVFAKGTSTITIGDGRTVTQDLAGRTYDPPIRRYTDTYNVASDAQVFQVNTSDYTKCVASSFSAIPVTADYSYGTASRQAVYALFDRDYTDAANARIVALYYFTPQTTATTAPPQEIPQDSSMLASMGNDPISGRPYSSFSSMSKPDGAPYARSTEPFEIVKDTMYYVGDNEVASYIFKCDMGYPSDKTKWKVIKLDAGWPNCGYIYYKNMEMLGIDPRSVTDLWLTHGHADHYGTAVDQMHMMDNAGLPITLWGSKEDTSGITTDMQGNAWSIAGALPSTETEIRTRTTKTYTYDTWYDFGNVQIYVTWSPGHTPGTTNMLFKVKNPVDSKFYTFGYHGGYGFNGLYTPTAANGYLRLDFQHGFSYLQQMFSADFVSPQHTNQYPMVETYQALKAYNRDPANASKQLTMMDVMTSTNAGSAVVNGTSITSEFSNQLEKRRSVVSYKASDAYSTNYKSIETSGPFKPGRESGLPAISAKILDDGKIIQGFNKNQNVTSKLPLMVNGVAMATDGYVHDPTGFYVQVYIDVLDSVYQGYLPVNYAQNSPGMNATITYTGGPVESIHAAKGTNHPPEVLRTQRLSSLADAQAVLATIKKGSTYTIALNSGSEIIVPTDVTKTFKAQ